MAGEIKQRLIDYARNVYDMGQNKFEEHCGITRGTINAIGKGISTATLEKILAACPEINLDWLISGTGEMKKPETARNPRSDSFSSEVEQVSAQGVKSENKGVLDTKDDEIRYLRDLVLTLTATIDSQQQTIAALLKTRNND